MFDHLLFRRLYWWQIGRFFRDAEIRNQFVPLLYQQFDATPSTRPAFFALNEDLISAVRAGSKTTPKLNEFRQPVRIIFGDADPYLNKGWLRSFMSCFRNLIYFYCPTLGILFRWTSQRRWRA
jgi:haloalkane dehalogenase